MPGQPGVPPAGDTARAPEAPRAARSRFACSLAMRRVYIDGEPWRGPQTQDRLVIQLAEGSHRVRIEKPGFQTFAVHVDVRAGETTSFNVSLLP